MIVVAFLVPLGIYLLLLGWVNRQPRPVLVSGVWDFIGMLFGVSGFLLLGGPAILSSLNERWRMFWVLGDTGKLSEGLAGLRQVGVLLAVAYFLVVVGMCIWALSRRRGITAIYNTEPEVVQELLLEVCQHLRLEPVQSGNLFVFGLMEAPAPGLTGIQPPHGLSRTGRTRPVYREEATTVEELAGQNAILELEVFPMMKHVSLRWEPHHSPLRTAVEAELERRLLRVGAPYHATGAWLTLIGSALLGMSMLLAGVLILRLILVG